MDNKKFFEDIEVVINDILFLIDHRKCMSDDDKNELMNCIMEKLDGYDNSELRIILIKLLLHCN